MADFARWDRGSRHSRVDVTKAICTYIKEKDLQNPENRRVIKLNTDLKQLLKIDDDTITYPKIQKYIGSHLLADPTAEPKKVVKPKKLVVVSDVAAS